MQNIIANLQLLWMQGLSRIPERPHHKLKAPLVHAGFPLSSLVMNLLIVALGPWLRPLHASQGSIATQGSISKQAKGSGPRSCYVSLVMLTVTILQESQSSALPPAAESEKQAADKIQSSSFSSTPKHASMDPSRLRRL